jgi:hypothetical protein
MPHWLNPNSILDLIVMIAVVVLRQAITTPSAAHKAALIAQLADDAAAVVLNLNPNASWDQKLLDVIARLKAASSLPTDNSHVIETAATGALVRLGHSNPVNGAR